MLGMIPLDRGLHPAGRMRVHQRRRDLSADPSAGADRSKGQFFSDGARYRSIRIEVVSVDDPGTGCGRSLDDPRHDRRKSLRPGRVQPARTVEDDAGAVASTTGCSWIRHICGQDIDAGCRLGPTGPTDQADPHAAGEELARNGKTERACPEDDVCLAHEPLDPKANLGTGRRGMGFASSGPTTRTRWDGPGSRM